MNMISTIFIYLLTPCLAYLAQLTYHSLFATLCLANPFSIVLLLSSSFLSDSKYPKLKQKQSSSSNNSNNSSSVLCEESSQCCSRYYDQLYLFYKHWLISTHATFLFIFQYYIVPSLKVSLTEVTILHGLYIGLILCVIHLRTSPRVLHAKCDQVCYLKLLANPMQVLVNSATFSVLCNTIHILILAQTTYLSLTYACSCGLTRFGTSILIPDDCADIYEEKDKRSVMFNALYSAQLMLCHLIFMLRTAKVTVY